MWSCINDAYNYCLNFTEGRDLYMKVFEEQKFPILENLDNKLGWS